MQIKFSLLGYIQTSCNQVVMALASCRFACGSYNGYSTVTRFSCSNARCATGTAWGAQHSTAQHSTAQHSTAQHSTAQHSTAHTQTRLATSTAQHSTAHTQTRLATSSVVQTICIQPANLLHLHAQLTWHHFSRTGIRSMICCAVCKTEGGALNYDLSKPRLQDIQSSAEHVYAFTYLGTMSHAYGPGLALVSQSTQAFCSCMRLA